MKLVELALQSGYNETMDNSWSTPVRLLLLLLLVAGAIWLLVAAAPLLQTIAIAALSAYLLHPLVRGLTKNTPLNWQGAAWVVFGLVLLLLLSIPVLLGTVAVNQMARFETDLMAAGREIRSWLFQPLAILGFTFQPQEALASLETTITAALASLPGGSLNVISSVTTNLLWGLVIVVMLFYFLRDGHAIKPWLVELMPHRYRTEVSLLLDEIDKVWGRFLRIQLLLFTLLTLLMVVGTVLIVGLFRIGLLKWSPLGFILLIALLYTGLQQVDNLWLRPRVLGRQLELHPALVFVSLIAGLTISGILGALIAVPVVATGRVVAKYLHRKWLGQPPWPIEDHEGETDEEEPETQIVTV